MNHPQINATQQHNGRPRKRTPRSIKRRLSYLMHDAASTPLLIGEDDALQLKTPHSGKGE